jgi:uncharacterized radical SAM superfamily Fe-S cluster-containing enzyme
MDEVGVLVGRTESVCPECFQLLEAKKVAYGNKIYLEKACPNHGFFSVLIWQGEPSYETWLNPKIPSQPLVCATEVEKGCPYDCGLCPEHRQHPCCVLLEITQQCNLKCPICFASAGDIDHTDPTMAEIKGWYQMLLDRGGPFNIQLSGGEPTMREDLKEIIAIGKQRGFPFIQLNTNGLRLAEESSYAKGLKEAGLDCVFLQFDGLNEQVYENLRGRPLLKQKMKAIENCGACGLGVVLVPTLAIGINDGEIGAILEFALEHMPTIRGVHFQPMSYFGRNQYAPTKERLTIPTILHAIEAQTKGKMPVNAFLPGNGENAYCSFHGNFTLFPGGKLKSLQVGSSGCCKPQVAAQKAKQAQAFVAKRWSAPKIEAKPVVTELGMFNTDAFDIFLERTENYTLAVSGMAFQDAWNLDLDRLKECYIHVVSEGDKLIPFCAYNLTDTLGRALYRGKKYE